MAESWGPRDVHILTPKPMNVLKDFSDVMRLKTMRYGDCPGMSRWPQYSGPYRREAGRSFSERPCDDRSRSWNDSTMSQELLAASKLEKMRSGLCPGDSRKEQGQPC